MAHLQDASFQDWIRSRPWVSTRECGEKSLQSMKVVTGYLSSSLAAGGFSKGRDIETLAAHIDVLPTLADLCKLPTA
jgi:hypothetical protein